jgi:hypothetical protein
MSVSESEIKLKASPIVQSMKFAWQSFKVMIDLVKMNYKMMGLHKTLCEEAFDFMISNNRIKEAKKIFDILASQVKIVQRMEYIPQEYESIPNKIDLARYDHVQKMLDLRFEILNKGIQGKFFAECYKMYDDIGYLIHRLDQNAKEMRQMPNIGKYEQKYYIYLSELVWVAEFHLHHAVALYREYNILDMKKKALRPEEKQAMISRLVMAILSTPPHAGSQLSPLQLQKHFRYILGGETVISDFDVEAHYNRRITELFMVSAMPSRDVIIKDIHRRNLMLFASPEIAKLFNFLEGEMHTPATFVKEASGLLSAITAKMPELKRYEKSVLKTMSARIVEKIARYYKRIRLDKLKQFLPERITDGDCEKMIVECSKAGTISATIDNNNKVLVFHTNGVHASSNRLRLTEFTKTLKKAVELIDREMLAAEIEKAKGRLHEKILTNVTEETKEINKIMTDMEEKRHEKEKAKEDKRRREQELKRDPVEIERRRQVKETQRKDFRKDVLTKNIVELTEKKKKRLKELILRNNPKIKFQGKKLNSIDTHSITLQDLEAIKETVGKSEEETLGDIIKKEVKGNDIFVRALREEESKVLLPKWKEQTTRLYKLEVQVAEERKKEHQELTAVLNKIKSSKEQYEANLKDNIMKSYEEKVKENRKQLASKYEADLVKLANELMKVDEEEKKKRAEEEEAREKIKEDTMNNKNLNQDYESRYKDFSNVQPEDVKIQRSTKTREEMQKEAPVNNAEPRAVEKTPDEKPKDASVVKNVGKTEEESKSGKLLRKKEDEEVPKETQQESKKWRKDPPKEDRPPAADSGWRKKPSKEPAKEVKKVETEKAKKEEGTNWRRK